MYSKIMYHYTSQHKVAYLSSMFKLKPAVAGLDDSPSPGGRDGITGVWHRTSFGDTWPTTVEKLEPNKQWYSSPYCSWGNAFMPTDIYIDKQIVYDKVVWQLIELCQFNLVVFNLHMFNL